MLLINVCTLRPVSVLNTNIVASHLCTVIHSPWPISCYSCLLSVETLNNISDVEVEPLPRAVLQAFSSQFEKSHTRDAEIPEADLSGIDVTVTRSLMPFQQHGVK